MAEDRRRQIATGYPFPSIPRRWGEEERQFAFGLRNLFDDLFNRNVQLKRMYPVGMIVFTGANAAPFSFGAWEAVTTGISGVYAWKRIA